MSDESFTEDEIRAFSDKLHAWGGTLEDKERALLRSLLISAEGDSEVEGFSAKFLPQRVGSPMVSLSDQAFGTLKPLASMDQPWTTAAYADTWKPT